MSALGERVARAYGWSKRCFRWGVQCWNTESGVGGSRRWRKGTPDPENSWSDLGAFLEWAEERLASHEEITDIMAHAAQSVDCVSLSWWKRRVIEDVLKLWRPNERN